MRKNIIKVPILFIVLLSLLVFTACTHQSTPTSENKKTQNTTISVRLPIPVVDAAFIPLYIAQDKSIFEKYGLSVRLEPGSPELNPVAMVAQQQDTIGIAGGPELFLRGRDKGADIIAFGLLHKNSNFPTILVKEDSPIKTLEDLEGKKVGFYYGHISTDILRELFTENNVVVEEVDVGFNYQLFITDQIDAQFAFTTTQLIILPAQGINVREISPASYGLITHGYTFFTHEETARTQPKMLENFYFALREATDYALKNPDEAYTTVIKRDSTIQVEIVKKQRELYAKGIRNNVPYMKLDIDALENVKQRMINHAMINENFDLKKALYLIE